MSQSLLRLIVILLLAGAAAAAGLVATRSFNGEGNGNPGAKQLFDQALGSNPSFKSGRFSANLDVKLRGAPTPELGRPVQMQISGAFEQGRTQRRPKLALDASMNAVGRSVRFGVIATGNNAFVSLGGDHYAVPESQLDKYYNQAAPPGQAISALGFDPRSWLKDATDEGDATVGGVEPRHLSASLDTDRLIDDVVGFARRAQPTGVPELPEEQLDALKNAIQGARIDLYTGRSDGIPRRATIHAAVQASAGDGQIDFDVTFSGVNKFQRIKAPPNAKPFSELESDLRTGALGFLSGQSSVGGTGGSGSPRASGSAGAPPIPTTAQAYLGCVRRAASRAALQRCAGLLP